jgi:hypothetical protein
LLVIISFPAALIFGVIGIIYDSKKMLAIISTLIAGGLILFWIYKIGM